MTDGATRRIADQLERRGLAVPARLLADAHRPLAPLLSDLGAAFGPFIGTAVGQLVDDPRALLDDPHGLDDLVTELDRRESQGGTRADSG
jgi:hypothetical protein